MSHSIETWLRQLDVICAEQGFESAVEAEAWLKSMSEGLDIEEFFDQHSPAESHLKGLLYAAEQVETPEEAIKIYERAIRVGERFFASAIIDCEGADVAWEESPLHLYTMALMGLAACQEWLMQGEAAELTYRKILRADPLDHSGAFDKLFCLLVARGLVADARELHENRLRNDAFALYQKGILAILECTDMREMKLAQGEEIDEMDESEILRPAMHALDQALRANRYVPSILTHPQGMSLEWKQAATSGSPSEAVIIAHTMAHLWLGDWLALQMLLQQATRFPLSHGGHEEEWQSLLNQLGGEPTSEDKIAYLQSIEAQAMDSSL